LNNEFSNRAVKKRDEFSPAAFRITQKVMSELITINNSARADKTRWWRQTFLKRSPSIAIIARGCKIQITPGSNSNPR